MKKTYFLMLLALVFLVFSCRSELDNLQENESKSVSSKKSFSSRLISLKTVQEEVKSFNSIQAKFTNSKLAKSVTAKSFNNNYLYRKLENAETGTITYTLPLNSYSAAKPYYFIQQIIVASSGTETVQYLKIIPNNAPAYKTQDVLKNLTGSIELYDENLEMVASTAYVNGVAQTTASSDSGNTVGKTYGECDVDIITIEVPCSNSGQHGVGESCDPGYTNDAHYETTIYISCPRTFGPSTGNPGSSSGGGSSLGGGYVFDEQLNSLLTNPTFLYGDYITSPNHELLLQAVRAWIPNHVTDINGDLSDLNQRIEHFVNNDELFTNLVTYNQNTPNVPNAEAADYSIRVYELIKWLLDNPSPQNGQLAAWGVSFFDQNRFVSWDQFKNKYILNTGFVTYINSLPLNLNQIITSQSNQDFFYGLNSYYISQSGSQQAKDFINWTLQFKANNPTTTWQQFEKWFTEEPISASLQNELFEDWAEPTRVKPTTRFKKHIKINSIYNKIKTAANFKQYLQNFEPTFSVAHLLFDIGACQNPNALAETAPPANYWIVMTFNKDKDWTNIPKVVIADTFMHEMIHAEIFRKLLSLSSSNGNIDTTLITQYLNSHNYPGLFDYYIKRTVGNENWQHEAMAAHYVNIMMNFLKQVYGSQYTDIEYKTIVWMGLQGTIAWNLLQQSERDLYISTWNTKYWLWEL